MSTLLNILVNDILPIFVVIGLGYVFARRTRPELRTTSRLTFYVLSPTLVFVSLIKSNIAGNELARLTSFTILSILTMGTVAWFTTRSIRLTRQQTLGFILAVMFVNSGNYGLGVVGLAFGSEAESRAIIYYACSSMLVYTLGTLIASGFKGGWRGTVKHLLTLPHLYALLAVFIIRFTQWQIPKPIMDGLNLTAQATIPVMLLLLGAQLASASVGTYWKPATVGATLRLLVAPFVAIGFAKILNLTGPAQQAGILEASMPPAVISTIIANEYEAEPHLVTGMVVLSTLISPLTLSIVIAALK